MAVLPDEQIAPQSDLGKAMIAAKLYYQGDTPAGFIKGWDVRNTEVEDLQERIEHLEKKIRHALNIGGLPYRGMGGESKRELRDRGQSMMEVLRETL